MTFHWSSMQDTARPLNLTHKHLTVWHETNASSGSQFALQLGLPLGSNDTSEAASHSWKMLERNNSVVFTSPLNYEEWQNFAVTVDIPNKCGFGPYSVRWMQADRCSPVYSRFTSPRALHHCKQ